MHIENETTEEYLIHFCRDYTATTDIPVSLRKKSVVIYSSQAESMGIQPHQAGDAYLYYEERNGLEFCSASEHIQYARIPVNDTDYDIYLGPIFPTGISDEIIRNLMREQLLSFEYKEKLEEYVRHIPSLTGFQLARHMVLVNRCINHEVVDTNTIFGLDETVKAEEKSSEYYMLSDDELINQLHAYQERLCEIIKRGHELELQSYLFTYSNMSLVLRYTSSDLRNARNQFIIQATQLVSQSAIPAGVSPREAIELSTRYIRQCESTSTVTDIASLEYSMFKEFCRLCKEASMPSDISGEAIICLNYIRNHVNDNISVQDIASSINRSESYTMKLFREELGITTSQMITRCKLEEAKSLLSYSNISLSEISSYLCFSSQSYFQNLFKKQYGITPSNYRKEMKKI